MISRLSLKSRAHAHEWLRMSDAERAMTALIELMARLRDPVNGCPWDCEQTFATIAPYTIEEAYEVADAIDRGEQTQLRDELGDLLFQIVFHSRMAEEKGWFDFAAVATAIHAKLVRRHPHVFAGGVREAPERQNQKWEELKAQERAQRAGTRDTSALADVPKALPALSRAAKLGRRAGRVGFDWQQPEQVRDKVLEELHEVDEAVTAASPERVAEELGDLLFAVANWTRHLRVDPEEALRDANVKFERRFRHMEAVAGTQGLKLESLSAAEWEDLWNQAKENRRAKET
jgi:nucleoside triphosphate diphosphatase